MFFSLQWIWLVLWCAPLTNARSSSYDQVSLLSVFLEELPVSPYELANDRTAQHRASGWKLEHFSSQLQEQVRVREHAHTTHTHIVLC